MKRLSKAMIAGGAIIALLSACCIDSDGIYGYAAGISCMLGLIIIITGFSVGFKNILAEEREKRRERLGIEDNLSRAGYEEIGTGIFVPEEDAYRYAMERISWDEDLKSEFVEWFYSGNWIKED